MSPRSAARGAVRTVRAAPALLERVLAPLCLLVGGVGFVALCALLALRVVPTEHWPAVVAPGDWPTWTVAALVAAALLGWALMQQGQARLTRRLGRGVAFVAFVLLPLLATALTWALRAGHLTPESLPASAVVVPLAAWYTTGAAVLSLLAFLLHRSRPRSRWYLDRGASALLLVAPYVVLLALIGTGLADRWIGGAFEDAVDTLGRFGLLLHVAATWLVGDPTS